MARRQIICVQCKEEGKHAARGLCNRCYKQLPEQLEKGRVIALNWYHNNTERSYQKEKERRMNDDYRKERNTRDRANYAKDSTKRRTSVNKWQSANPDYVSNRANRRRARKLNAPGSHTLKEWKQKIKEFDHRCAYCDIEQNKLTRDHVIPLCKGGSDDIDNIVPSCVSCNSRKGTKLLHEFAA